MFGNGADESKATSQESTASLSSASSSSLSSTPSSSSSTSDEKKGEEGSSAINPTNARLLYGLMYNTVEEESYKYFDTPPIGDGFYAWTALLSHFEKKTAPAQLALLEKLIGYPWNESNQTTYDETDFIREFTRHVTLTGKTCRSSFPHGIPGLVLRACLIKQLRHRSDLTGIIANIDLQQDMSYQEVITALRNHRDILRSTVTTTKTPQVFYGNEVKRSEVKRWRAPK